MRTDFSYCESILQSHERCLQDQNMEESEIWCIETQTRIIHSGSLQPYWMATNSCKWNRAIYQDTSKNAPLKQWSLSLLVSPVLFSTCFMKYSSSAWSVRSYFDDTAPRRIMGNPQFPYPSIGSSYRYQVNKHTKLVGFLFMCLLGLESIEVTSAVLDILCFWPSFSMFHTCTIPIYDLQLASST